MLSSLNEGSSPPTACINLRGFFLLCINFYYDIWIKWENVRHAWIYE